MVAGIARCLRGPPVAAYDVGAAPQLVLDELHNAGCGVWIPDWFWTYFESSLDSNFESKHF